MSSDLEPKKEARVLTIMLLACVFLMTIPFIAWFPQTKANIIQSLGWLFAGVDVILTGCFVVVVRKNYKLVYEHETDLNGPRWLMILIALAEFFWVAGWAAYQNELIK